MPKFNWDQFESEDAQPSGKFNWDHFESEPSTDTKEPKFFDGTVKNTIDSLPMIGGAVGGILGTPADVVAGPMGNVAGAAIGGYVGTAAKNLINRYYDPQSAPKNMTEVLSQPVTGGIEQAGWQAGGEMVGVGLQTAAKAGKSVLKWAAPKALSNAFGVAPDTIKEYAQYSDRINSAKDMASLKNVSDDFVGKLSSDVDAGKISADQAQAAYNQHLSDMKDAYKTAGYDARDAATSAHQTLKDAHNARIQQLSGDVYDSVKKLKSEVVQGSNKALNTLDKSQSIIDLKPTYGQVDAEIAKARAAGTDESHGLADKLQAWKDRQAGTYGNEAFGVDAKKLINPGPRSNHRVQSKRGCVR
jgi:hypothetical protein